MLRPMANPEYSSSRKWLSDPRGWPVWARALLVACGYFLLAQVGLEFSTITANISPIWPPSGLAVGALMVGGLRLWPGVALGSLLGSLSAEAPPGAAALMALGNTLEAFTTVALLRSLFGFRGEFEHPRHVFGFIVLLGMVGTPLSALFGAGSLWLDGSLAASSFFPAWLTWWGGNFTGGLVLGPLFIAAYRMVPSARAPARLRELILSALLLVGVGGTVLVWGGRWGLAHPALLVLPLPLVVWIAWRFAIGGAALSLLLLSALAVSGAALGLGPFVSNPPAGAYGLLLIYIVVVATTSLVLAAFNVEREKVLARLRQSEWQITEAQRIGDFGVWSWELRTGLFRLSEGGLRLLGETSERFEPRIDSLRTRVHPDDLGEFDERIRSVRQRCQPETWELRVIGADGKLRHVTVTCAALRSGRALPELLLGTLFDLSDRKRHEDEHANMQRKLLETQKLESLGLLAGGIAHDFNNLLTGVLGNASLLRAQLSEDNPMHAGLRRIESAAERAAQLCRQMLAYSGKGRFAVRSVELNEIVANTLLLAQSSVPPHAEVSFHPAKQLPPIKADALQLRQILLNLVLNAVEAIPEKGGRVAVRTGTMGVDRTWLAGAYLAPQLPDGEYVFLEVEDTGLGIAEEHLAKIFDPFFSTKFVGRGLGLPAVAGVMRAHQGAVRVGSRLGQGSTFRVVFPVAPPEEARSEELVAPKLVEGPPTEGVVLVVDDESTVRQVTSDLLDGTGLAARAAVDGFHALELFGENGAGVSAVLLDYTMPRLDGFETFKRLRERKADIPVLLMSGFAADHVLDRFEGLGLSGFVQKPFTRGELLAALARAGVRGQPGAKT